MSSELSFKVGVVGLGYVGLPLSVEFAKHCETVGFDVNLGRVKDLKRFFDATAEVSREELESSNLRVSSEVSDLAMCNFFIVTVPTPILQNKTPDLTYLMSACDLLGTILGEGDIVVFESTVYPGCTEEVCIPALEASSGLRFGVDFFVGYSPERINPGDKNRGVSDIVKVVSGSDKGTLQRISDIYGKVVSAGVHQASSIKVAEAAKVIENVQRDVNIALVNELSKLFARLEIDTHEVLTAAATKWNFLKFFPGLVGGHCIGVDPYYLSNKAAEVDFNSELILSARRVNDSMAEHAATLFLRELARNNLVGTTTKILVMGATFKENCPDMRNSKIVDLVNCLVSYNLTVEIFDPLVESLSLNFPDEVVQVKTPEVGAYDGVILAVGHDFFLNRGVDYARKFGKPGAILFDLKSAYPRSESHLRL